MFALGMVYWMYHRAPDHTIDFFNKKFKKNPSLIEANTKVLNAGYYYSETLELIPNTYNIAPAKMPAGTYRVIMGNTATAWGFLAAAEKSGLELFLGSYPITPASDILHELVKHKHFGVKTLQAEDEIAGITSAIGASFAGDLAITTTSGPGLALKGEALGLAMMVELPLVVVDVQRGGPSTGLPTKTEQSDLLQAMYGRNGESPLIVIAASTPANCFHYAYHAAKLTLEHMTPVVLLTDGYIANGSAPWRIRSVGDMPEINSRLMKEGTESWHPYDRDPETLARSWAIPGTAGLEHRVGGLEKDSTTGDVSYVPENHEEMTRVRAEKIKRVEQYIPEIEPEFTQSGELLVIGWGGTYGALHTAVKQLNSEGHSNIGFAHFHYLNPLPRNTEEVLGNFKKLLVCELNNGQFASVLKINFSAFEFLQYNKIQGLPFGNDELVQEFKQYLG